MTLCKGYPQFTTTRGHFRASATITMGRPWCKWPPSRLSARRRSRAQPPPSNRKRGVYPDHVAEFLGAEQTTPASLLRILLIRAGIEVNTGLRVKCCTCKKAINKQGSIKCAGCHQYSHIPCTQIRSPKDWTPGWNCKNCTQPVPTRAPVYEEPTRMDIMQWNCNGIGNKVTKLAAYIHSKDAKIAALQETKLGPKSTPPNSGSQYTLIRQGRPGGRQSGGLAFLSHQSVLFTRVEPAKANDGTMEAMTIKVKFNKSDVKLVNFYIPSKNSCPDNYTASIQPLLLSHGIVLGDANAHNGSWHSSILDPRGISLATEIANSNFGVLNTDSPTRLTSDAQATSLDISMASYERLTSASWRTETTLNSDHLPILIELQTSSILKKAPKRTFTNILKADWKSFEAKVEATFSRYLGAKDFYQGNSCSARPL